MSESNDGTVTVQATQSFATYVDGDCLSVAGGQMVVLPKANADALEKGGLVVSLENGGHAEDPRGVARPGRVVSDVVPDPVDATEWERTTTSDPSKGRVGVDAGVLRARKAAEDEKVDGRTEAQKGQPDIPVEEVGEHTDPAKDGEAAKGSYTTGKEDVSKGSKPASKPIKTGQTTAKRKPRASGSGPVADPDKPIEEQDPDLKEDDRSTVDDKAPVIEPTGPNRDEPTAPDPSPGTVKKPS